MICKKLRAISEITLYKKNLYYYQVKPCWEKQGLYTTNGFSLFCARGNVRGFLSVPHPHKPVPQHLKFFMMHLL